VTGSEGSEGSGGSGGAGVRPAAGPSLEELSTDPHRALAELRQAAPVAWVEALNGWIVVGHRAAEAVMRDAETFTVDDPRFSTSQVVGPSMLSTDGAEHTRHRQPFVTPFSPRVTRALFADFVQQESDRLVAGLAPEGRAELRTGLAAPLATASMRLALGLERIPVPELLGWYAAIVGAVSEITAGRPRPASGDVAYQALTTAIRATLADAGPDSFLGRIVAGGDRLTTGEMLSNTAVLLFGGIETTEGMIATLFHHLLSEPDRLTRVAADPELLAGAVEESLRLEPAAASVDRYTTRDTELDGVKIPRGDLVVVSLAAANRDPGVFPDPDRFDPTRDNLRRQLAFARGPHTCVGLHLARLQARVAVTTAARLPGLHLDPDAAPPAPAGLVFRKPPAVEVRWTP
jgi:cytochrome P450